MVSIRFFHEIYGDVHELPDGGPFPHERGLQEFFEKHLCTLTGIDFLDSEYSTGQQHGRRIDTLGIDGGGRPVVVEYKRRRDENVINQGLDYLAWLEDHRAEFRELVREKLGDARVARIDFGTPRLLCIAAEFLRQDRIAAQNSRRRVDLLSYRRYGDAYVALEWVYGGEAIEPGPRPAVTLRHATEQEQAATAPPSAGSSARGAGIDPDYSPYPAWNKTREETRRLLLQLKTSVESLGHVRTDAHKTCITFTRQDVLGRGRVIAHVNLRIKEVRIRLEIAEKHLRHIPLKDGFSRPSSLKGCREITVRNDADIQRAEPLLRAAHDGLSAPAPR